ncbi:MAG TPA: ABC transporter permease [Verrucomicrobiota bacterium]|nr:cyclic nucleotide-binding protein [Verrucomicrobiales bacterium]HRI14587.1 ABC transporter permease [Verrucomicrobiota bacterium]
MIPSTPRWARLLQAGGPFLGLLLVCGLFGLTEERAFIFTGGNLKNILTQTVIVAVGALGMTLIIVGGGIDLSVGSVVAFTGVLGAKLLVAGWSPLGTTAALVIVGGTIGMFNGAIVAGFRMMPFIVTLGMMGVVRGAAKWLGNNQTINAPPESPVGRLMARVNPAEFWPLPWGVWIALGLSAVMALLLRETVFGRHVFAIGANETAARYSGVRVRGVKMATYAIAGLLFGFAGLLQMSRLTQGDPTVAIGLELDIIAAVVIGGASLNGGAGSIGGSLIGALIMALLRNGTNQLGWQTYTQEIIIGAVIVLAVGLDKWRETRLAAR